jgi:hypothetical protein
MPHDKWMEHRIGLFRDYCASSVLRQTKTNFHWHILFDKDTSDEHLQAVEDALQRPTRYNDGPWVTFDMVGTKNPCFARTALQPHYVHTRDAGHTHLITNAAGQRRRAGPELHRRRAAVLRRRGGAGAGSATAVRG